MRKSIILCCLLLSIPCSAKTITVDDDKDADYSSIQEAINHAQDYDVIEVQRGTYNEHIDFHGKAIRLTGTNPNDMNTVYATVIDGGETGTIVLFQNNEDTTSVLTGLTIQYAVNAIRCDEAHPLIKDCVIQYAQDYGIFCIDASPTVLGCLLQENFRGITRSRGPIRDCVITSNDAGLQECDGGIINCVVSNNSTYGLMWCHDSQIRNCIIRGNGGSGIVARRDAHSVTNCTIVGNMGYGIETTSYPEHLIANNIIVLNRMGGIKGDCKLENNNVWHNMNFDYSGVSPGETDISVNPLFATNGYWADSIEWVEGDYHLRSTAGWWNGEGWEIDEIDSPCIDAGSLETPIGAEPNPNGGRINMGAYGGTAEASKSGSGVVKPICLNPPAMDFNDDCIVNMADLAAFATDWLACGLDIQDACWQ